MQEALCKCIDTRQYNTYLTFRYCCSFFCALVIFVSQADEEYNFAREYLRNYQEAIRTVQRCWTEIPVFAELTKVGLAQCFMFWQHFLLISLMLYHECHN